MNYRYFKSKKDGKIYVTNDDMTLGNWYHWLQEEDFVGYISTNEKFYLYNYFTEIDEKTAEEQHFINMI